MDLHAVQDSCIQVLPNFCLGSFKFQFISVYLYLVCLHPSLLSVNFCCACCLSFSPSFLCLPASVSLSSSSLFVSHSLLPQALSEPTPVLLLPISEILRLN